jgi:hypothetical protein
VLDERVDSEILAGLEVQPDLDGEAGVVAKSLVFRSHGG